MKSRQATFTQFLNEGLRSGKTGAMFTFTSETSSQPNLETLKALDLEEIRDELIKSGFLIETEQQRGLDKPT